MTATDDLKPLPADTEDCLPSDTPPAASPGERSQPLPIPIRTVPLLLVLLAAGLLPLIFALRTVHSLDPGLLSTQPGATRTQFSIKYWLDHGYFRSFGLLARPTATPPGYHFYKSSTGGHMLTGFVVEKVCVWVTGRPSWRLLALHNQIWTLLVAVTLGLLGFRLALRLGAHPRHALVMAICVEIVHFTFPDNLALYFEMNGRPYWLFFAAIFLVIEESGIERRTRLRNVAQGVAAFLLTYMEYVAGMTFIASFVIVSLLLRRNELPLKRLLRIAIIPALLALSLFGAQRALVRTSNIPTEGSEFLFRTGLDGSSVHYGDHLDIIYRRDVARNNFPHNRPYLFRWQWLFLAGTASVLTLLVLAMRGKVASVATISLLSLLGTYLLTAALFSQAVMIHPYLFDLLLFTPLILALFVLTPTLIEAMTEHRGIAVAAVLFLAVWVAMVQMRRYAMQYPRPPRVTSLPAAGTHAGQSTGGPSGIARAVPDVGSRALERENRCC